MPASWLGQSHQHQTGLSAGQNYISTSKKESEVENLSNNKYQRILVLLSADACFKLSEMLFR